MAVKTVTYTGEQLTQQGTPLSYFTISSDEGLVFTPYLSNGDKVSAWARTTYHPQDITNPLWNSVEIEWTRVADVTPADFSALFSLYGITNMGDIVLIGEEMVTTCPTTETTEKIVFNLLNSACEPGLTKLSTVAASGKIDLKLPMRYLWFDEVNLYPAWADYNDTKCKVLPITGINTAPVINNASNFPVSPVDVTYDSDMNSDFSDIRFYVHNGVSLVPCIHTRVRYVASTSARFVVEIPYLPIYPNQVYLLMFYGDSSKSTASVNYASGTMVYFDDWEDGLYSGRTAPYKNWTLNGGTGSVSSSSPIGDTYSIIHTGAGSGSDSATNTFDINIDPVVPYSTRISTKLMTQGVGSNTPDFFPWWQRHNTSNGEWLGLRCYYDGTYQTAKIAKVESSTYTVLGSGNIQAGKMSAGATWIWLIRNLRTSIDVFISTDGGVTFTNVVGASVTSNIPTGKCSIGANRDTSVKFDNLRIFSPAFGYKTHNGRLPTAGSWGSELSVYGDYATLDSGDVNLTTLRFSKPASWTDNAPAQAWVGLNGSDQWTRPAPVKATGTYALGYDGLDRFQALRVDMRGNCNEDYHFNINKINWKVQL